MLEKDIVTLSRRAERLRFRIAHHLGGDPALLEGLLADLAQLNPWHPLAMNERARRALPETFTPDPGPHIATAARLFAQGRLDAAVAATEGLDDAALIRCDLECLRGKVGRAEVALEAAAATFGQLPPVRVRAARLALLRGEGARAWLESSHALADNPIYGTARELHGQAAAMTKCKRISLPVRSPVRFVEGHAHYPSTLSPRARSAWRAWARARDLQGPDTVPPGATAHAALLEAWRREPEEPPFYREEPNTEVETLERWDREGLLTAYQWSAGLSFRNATTFRSWKVASGDALLRFWTRGVLQLPVQE